MSIEAMKLALSALKTLHDENMDYFTRNKLGGENNQCMVFAREAIETLRAAIEQAEKQRPHYTWQYAKDYIASRQAEPEPVAWMDEKGILWNSVSNPDNYTALYTAPPKREWVCLTDEEIYEAVKDMARAVEAKLKEKNIF